MIQKSVIPPLNKRQSAYVEKQSAFKEVQSVYEDKKSDIDKVQSVIAEKHSVHDN